MRRLGSVVGTAQGRLIVRSPDDSRPSIGERVVDDGLAPVGTVLDVIGPVSRPYVVVDPADDRPVAGLLGDRLYVR